MRTEEIDLFNLEIARPKTNSSPCESVCALRLRSEINKSYRDEKRFLFISPREFVGNADSHGLAVVQLAGGNQE